ncbi:MAG: hypothetical protein PHQ00_04985, partial [Phycisphaerae bacterium]|nr:hypothetical protein [Phycisphaerae bacterium]
RDMLFFINNFAWTFDPRLTPKSTVVPFITYDAFQDAALDEIKEAIEVGFDELSEKSRDMGASWMYLTVFVWFWLFRPYNAFRMVSRNENLVDNSDDPDALFWKVQFLLDHLPSWLKPNFKKVHLNLVNYDNGSTIGGCTTTSDAARGGRCTAMLLDEFAAVPDGDGILSATRDVTKCRLFNSTHKGLGTAFYRLSIGKIRKLVLHWALHPVKAKGLYFSRDGKVVMVDENFKGEVVVSGVRYKFPEEYPFRLDGKLRSPWYDNECDRAAHPMEIAQELDMDPFASDFVYFDDPDLVPRIEREDVRNPLHEGILEFDADTLDPMDFVEGKNGHLKLWVNYDIYKKMPIDLSVVIGIDISAGTGASNSAASVVNRKTGEKIAEYANPHIKPEAFAKVVIALAKWFNDAYLLWDGGGPGRTYGDETINLGYRNIYYRRNEKSLSKKVSDIPGCFLVSEEKKAVLGAYRKALKERTFTQRSHEANTECLSYIYSTSGTIEHSGSVNAIDPSGAGANHGDRVIADALANKALNLMRINNTPTQTSTPMNCYAARKAEFEKKQRQKDLW